MKDISLHILDIVQNSISAKAKLIEISVEDMELSNEFVVKIQDDGKGISPDLMKTITDPWTTTRTTRKVGLGIPLFKQNAELTGGEFCIESQLGEGTLIVAHLVNNHIDRLPLGDLVGVYLLLVSANPEIDFVISHKTDKNTFVFDTREVKMALDGLPLNTPEIRQFLKEMLQENIAILY